MRRGFGVILGMAIAVWPAVSNAQEVHELRHDVATDIVVTATAMTLIISAELAKPTLANPRCRWCDRDENGKDDLNFANRGMRNALKWNDTTTAGHAADGMAFLAAPSVAFVTLAASGARDHVESKVPIDILITLETLGVSGVVNEIVKFAIARERPFVHALAPEEKPKTPHPSDNDLSFYSGHTSLTFTLAGASGTVASLRGYRLAPLVWASGLSIAAVTGYLRIAADKHYFTDVLTGMILGSAIGVGVPLLFHGRRTEETHVPLPTSGSLGAATFPVTLSGAF